MFVTRPAPVADNPGKAKTKADPPASVQRQDRFQAILKEPAKEEGSGARPLPPKKNLSNVLTYMKKTDVKGGPMALLSGLIPYPFFSCFFSMELNYGFAGSMANSSRS